MVTQRDVLYTTLDRTWTIKSCKGKMKNKVMYCTQCGSEVTDKMPKKKFNKKEFIRDANEVAKTFKHKNVKNPYIDMSTQELLEAKDMIEYELEDRHQRSLVEQVED